MADMKAKTKTTGKITAGSPTDILDIYWKDYQDPQDNSSFPRLIVNVMVAGTCLPPRHEMWDFIRDMGMPHIEKVLFGQPGLVGVGDSMYFIFPDRWMIPAESMEFLHRLHEHPEIKACKKRTRVVVLTNQPYIVGSCMKEQVRMMNDGGEHFRKLNYSR